MNNIETMKLAVDKALSVMEAAGQQIDKLKAENATLRQAIEQAQQAEPLLWAGVDFDIKTSSSPRQWVGLTDEEVFGLWEMAKIFNQPKHFYLLVEAKLKEKNT